MLKTKLANIFQCCGPDDIFLEHLILGGRKTAEALATLFNNHGHLILDQMNECNIVLTKKPNSISNDISSFRPISILQTIFKIYTGTLLERIQDKIENCISSSQAGEYKKDLYAIFIDFKKAFDSVNHSWLLYSLAINDFDEELVKRIEALYRSPKATFSTGINNSYTTIEVKSGIRQSDTLSPKLFIFLLEIILKNAQNDLDECFKKEESNLVKVMIDGTPTLTEKIAQVIEYHDEKTGLELNKSKIKMMATQYKNKLDNPIYEVVSNYKYLGTVVSMDLKEDNNDFNECAKVTWRLRFKNKELLNRADYKNKLKIYNCIIRPATLYSIESMRPTIMLINKFVSLEKNVLYSIFKKEIYPTKCIKYIILDRIEKAKKPFDVYVEKEWKRPVGRPSKRLLSLIHDNSFIKKQTD